MDHQVANTFESIESAHEFARLLSEAVAEAKQDIDADVYGEEQTSKTPRRLANLTGHDTDGNVSMYTIDATTGGLTPLGTIATELSPTSIAIHPSGKFAYVTNSGSNSVSMYSIDSATGTLTLIGTIGT
jgi:YVTN family beta-propeller protein